MSTPTGTPEPALYADETYAKPQPRTLHTLAAVRLIPSLLIVVSHFSFLHMSDGHASRALFTAVNPAGCNAVSFFMVLSGFILVWINERPEAVQPSLFLVKRVLRVWPVHLLAAAIALIVTWKGEWTGVLNVLLLHAWVPSEASYYSLNAPSWTLCTELLLYGVFPWIFLWLSRRSDVQLIGLLVGVIATIMVLPFALTLFPDKAVSGNVAYVYQMHAVAVSNWKYWIVYIFPPVRLLECVVGVIVCILVRRKRWPTKGIYPAVALLIAAVLVEIMWLPYLFALTATTIVPITLIIGVLAARELKEANIPHLVTRFSSLGKFTFGIYMYQWPLLLVLGAAFAKGAVGDFQAVLLMVLFYLCCISSSYLSFNTVEKVVQKHVKVLLGQMPGRRKEMQSGALREG